MKISFYSLILLMLIGCQGMPQGNPDFYTWVDETGQIRTIKKEKDKVSKTAATENNSTETIPNAQLDESEYTSSEEIDKRLKDQRMFAWQDQSGNQIVREEAVVKTNEPDLSLSSTRVNEVSLMTYREGEQVLFSDIDGVSIKLNRYYRFNEAAQQDYLLIELDKDYRQIKLKSFVRNNSVAMPQIIPLNHKFKQEYSFENPYQFREPESWYGYGYLHGELKLPKNTQYILVLPSLNSGVIEAEEGLIIKQVNLGSLVFYAAE
ncbi:MAG: hypothetical protein JXR16_07245 [Bermanella sp.]